MIYYALLKAKNEGCDYTIGCNLCHHKLKATNLNDAKKELNRILKNYDGDEAVTLGWDEIILLECTQEINKIIHDKEWSDE